MVATGSGLVTSHGRSLKARVEDLAVLGGPVAFTESLHVGRPNIGDRERLRRRIEDMLDRRWLTNHGPFVLELEERLTELLGVRHCMTTSSGTLGLQVVAHALGLTGEVILPAFTFIASAHALRWIGLEPVFCDVDPATHNLDPDRVEELVTPRTSAILGVHLWGRPCDVEGLAAIADRHELRLFLDAAHAFGCTHQGKLVGGLGSAEVFSFHATKFVNGFEGGAITTDDDALAERILLSQNFGFEGFDSVVSLGTNAKMNEAAAAMMLTSLESKDEFAGANERNFAAYTEQLAGVPGLSLIEFDERETHNRQYVVAEVDQEVSGISRDRLVAVLHAENVLARRYFFPGCHRMEPYRTTAPGVGARLPVTEALAERVLVLPTGTAIGPDETAVIASIIRHAVAGADRIPPTDVP